MFLKPDWGFPTGERGYKAVVYRLDWFWVSSSFRVGGWVPLWLWRPNKGLYSEGSHEPWGLCVYIRIYIYVCVCVSVCCVHIWGKLPPRARKKWHLFSFWTLTWRKAAGPGFWNKWTVVDIAGGRLEHPYILQDQRRELPRWLSWNRVSTKCLATLKLPLSMEGGLRVRFPFKTDFQKVEFWL